MPVGVATGEGCNRGICLQGRLLERDVIGV